MTKAAALMPQGHEIGMASDDRASVAAAIGMERTSEPQVRKLSAAHVFEDAGFDARSTTLSRCWNTASKSRPAAAKRSGASRKGSKYGSSIIPGSSYTNSGEAQATRRLVLPAY